MAPELVSTVVLLVLVLDPFGNVPIVVAAMREVPHERRRRIIVRECAVAWGLLIAFLVGGKAFLSLMHLSETSLEIAGGVILFLIALRMVPIAVPAIAGPSALATVMLMASRGPGALPSLAVAVTIAMLVTLAVLAGADRVQRVIGERGVLALERLMGLVLTALAVEMLLSGLRTFAEQLPR
jgi:small neutral amino acid transporter SnatA (MarC family)